MTDIINGMCTVLEEVAPQHAHATRDWMGLGILAGIALMGCLCVTVLLAAGQ